MCLHACMHVCICVYECACVCIYLYKRESMPRHTSRYKSEDNTYKSQFSPSPIGSLRLNSDHQA